MLRQLDDKTLVSGQISADEVAELRRHGVTLIVNNRPDGEDDGQPPSVEIEQAAREAGIAYKHVPIRRGPGPAEVEEMDAALRECGEGKMLAFCRSGARSTFAWALARREAGADREEVERCAQEAGVSLAPISHLL
jgi:uncharacterized protein (TIGR01244 family)